MTHEMDGWIAELAELCAIPSVAAEGRGLEPAADWVRARLEGLGARVSRIEGAGAPVLFAELGPPSGAPTLLIYNHYDVQPADPLDLWESDPFHLTERDGLLYARGIADNKANLLSRIHAVERLLARGPLPLRIRWLIEGEEEIGSPNLATVAEAEGERWADSDGCLWEAGYKDQRGRMQLYAGLKGIAYLELRVRGANADKHSSLATLLPNPAWRLVWALATMKRPDETILVDGFAGRVAPPTEAEERALATIPFETEEFRTLHGVEQLVTGVAGRAALRRHLFEPTLTICGIHSGYGGPGSKTVLPATATAKLDFRLVPDLTPDLVHRLVRDHLDRRGFEDIEIVAECGEHPAQSDLDTPIVRAAVETFRALDAPEPVLWPRMAGSGPMYPVTTRYAIPTVGFGTGYFGSNVHAPNEHIRRADYVEGVEVAAHFFDRFARLGSDA